MHSHIRAPTDAASRAPPTCRAAAAQSISGDDPPACARGRERHRPPCGDQRPGERTAGGPAARLSRLLVRLAPPDRTARAGGVPGHRARPARPRRRPSRQGCMPMRSTRWPTTCANSAVVSAMSASRSLATTGAAWWHGTWPRARPSASTAWRSSTRRIPRACPSTCSRIRCRRCAAPMWASSSFPGCPRWCCVPTTMRCWRCRSPAAASPAHLAMTTWRATVRHGRRRARSARCSTGTARCRWQGRSRGASKCRCASSGATPTPRSRPGLAEAGAAFCGAACEVVHLPRATHWLQQEMPEEVNAHLLAFLADAGAAARA